jgi:hypothetical protein
MCDVLLTTGNMSRGAYPENVPRCITLVDHFMCCALKVIIIPQLFGCFFGFEEVYTCMTKTYRLRIVAAISELEIIAEILATALLLGGILGLFRATNIDFLIRKQKHLKYCIILILIHYDGSSFAYSKK